MARTIHPMQAYRDICTGFAKYSTEYFDKTHETEPCWTNKGNGTKWTSDQVFSAFMAWSKYGKSNN